MITRCGVCAGRLQSGTAFPHRTSVCGAIWAVAAQSGRSWRQIWDAKLWMLEQHSYPCTLYERCAAWMTSVTPTTTSWRSSRYTSLHALNQDRHKWGAKFQQGLLYLLYDVVQDLADSAWGLPCLFHRLPENESPEQVQDLSDCAQGLSCHFYRLPENECPEQVFMTKVSNISVGMSPIPRLVLLQEIGSIDQTLDYAGPEILGVITDTPCNHFH